MASNLSNPSSTKQEAAPATKTVKLDASGITNSYANVCNVSSTQEEVVLVFGVNEAWEQRGKDPKIKLTDRIILNPHAAKRLAAMLNNVVEQYEKKFGTLEAPGAKKTGEALPSGSA